MSEMSHRDERGVAGMRWAGVWLRWEGKGDGGSVEEDSVVPVYGLPCLRGTRLGKSEEREDIPDSALVEPNELARDG